MAPASALTINLLNASMIKVNSKRDRESPRRTNWRSSYKNRIINRRNTSPIPTDPPTTKPILSSKKKEKDPNSQDRRPFQYRIYKPPESPDWSLASNHSFTMRAASIIYLPRTKAFWILDMSETTTLLNLIDRTLAINLHNHHKLIISEIYFSHVLSISMSKTFGIGSLRCASPSKLYEYLVSCFCVNA